MFKDYYKKVNFKDPIVQILIALVLIAPFAVAIYLKIGVVLGLLMSLSILILYSKLPKFLLKFLRKVPLLSDLLMTVALTVSVSTFYGEGLTLAIAAISCDLILAYASPKVIIHD